MAWLRVVAVAIAALVLSGSGASAKKVFCEVAVEFSQEGSAGSSRFDALCDRLAREDGYDRLRSRDGVCTLCERGTIRSSDNGRAASTQLPGIPPELTVVDEPGQLRECKSTKAPYFITIRGSGGTPSCPKPWINRGKDRNFNPPARICAYCGPDYDPNRLTRFQCCRPK